MLIHVTNLRKHTVLVFGRIIVLSLLRPLLAKKLLQSILAGMVAINVCTREQSK